MQQLHQSSSYEDDQNNRPEDQNNTGYNNNHGSSNYNNHSGPEDTQNTSLDPIPFLDQHQEPRQKNLVPLHITDKLKSKKYPLEEPKFLEKVRQYNKYEIKSYEVTMLVQVLKNEDKIEIMQEDRLKKKFQTLLLQIFEDPKPLRISKITIIKDSYPHQVEMIVDFVTRIGKDPFHKVDLQPINYKEQGPANAPFPKYIVNYFLAIKEQTFRYPEDFIVMAKIGTGAFGEVNLVKYRRNNLIYALKILKKLNEKDMKAFLKFDDKNYGANNNIVREILFMKNLRDVNKLRHPNIVELENFWVQKEQDGNFRMYMLMSYFGGAELGSNCIFDFFFPNDGKSTPLHFDIGEEGGKDVIGQIFFQALEVVEFLHRQGYIHRDLKDDNFLIRRREGAFEQGYNIPYLIEIALCDFGLCGYIDKTCSLPTYNENRYRDTAHISEYPSACDIFSLGELLNMLIILYHFYFRHDVDEILSKFKDVYKEEMALARIMKADIQKRPKNFQELKQTPEYQKWLESIPPYIPLVYGDAAEFIE